MTPQPLAIDAMASAVAGRAILITGAARTGTTMMGQLVQSLDGVEYIFEPPTLFALMPLIDRIDSRQWRLLYETYLFEDGLMEALGGRRLNFNSNDDSYIYRTKSEAEIRARLSQSRRRNDLVVQAAGSAIAYKMPDMIPYVARLTELLPGTIPIVMLRRPDDVIASILKKGWFTDHALRHALAVWPFRHHGDLAIPFWVPAEDVETWAGSDEPERCARYFLYMYEGSHPDCAIVIDYDAFVANPAHVFALLTNRLKRPAGPKTKTLLSAVVPRRAYRRFEPKGVSAGLMARAEAAWTRWAQIALT